MDSAHVIYTPCPDSTASAESSALANVYRFILDCQQNAAAMANTNGATVRNTEEVRNVNRY
jgi:hypothetical protein